MPVSVEIYTLVNLCMNVIVIGIIARSQGSVRWKQVFLAAFVGTVYAIAMNLSPFWLLRTAPSRLALCFALAAIALRVERMADLFSGGVKLLLGTALLGGTSQLTLQMLGGRSMAGLALGATLGTIALFAALQVRSQRIEKWEVQICMRSKFGQVRFTALVDTGNRLHEPISGLPVLIVEEKHALPLMPKGFSASKATQELPPGFRLVGYGALGGTGKMACFKPEELFASYGDGWMRAPDVWVAIYPGALPGSIGALAPTVIGRIQGASRSTDKIERISRMERGTRR